VAVPKGTLKNPKLKKGARQLQVIPSLRAGRSPCHKCPLDKPNIQKVKPTIPKNPLLVAVGLHSGKREQEVLAAFVGDGGAMLRNEFNRFGLFAGNPHRSYGGIRRHQNLVEVIMNLHRHP